ncbi:MAG: glycosyltransferase [Candidatus Diapherotrites archaeon]|nr:glycosyltransferase [Candidatus Diapherotrites archaeon]
MDLSVIIPTLNEESYIRQCMESIRNQDYDGKYEVIIGDGVSTDRTVSIAEALGAKIVVEKKPTISAGRQKACEKARGRLILSSDADVNAPSDWLSTIENTFTDGVAGAHGNTIPYDGSRMDYLTCKYLMPLYSQAMVLMNIPSPAGSNLAFTRKDFEACGGFNTDLVTGEDVDLVRRLRAHGRFVFNPNAVVYVSMRRVKQWGRMKYLAYHTTNAIRMHTTGTSHNTYEPVR